MERKKGDLALLVMLAGAAVVGNLLHFSRPASHRHLELARLAVGSSCRDLPLEEDFLARLGARSAVFRSCLYRGRAFWLFAGYFDTQKEGSQVHSPKHCYPGSGWNVLEARNLSCPWAPGKVGRLVVSDGRERREVLYWYQTEGEVMASVFALKAQMVKKALALEPLEVVFVRLSTEEGEGTTAALEDLGGEVYRQIGELYRRGEE